MSHTLFLRATRNRNLNPWMDSIMITSKSRIMIFGSSLFSVGDGICRDPEGHWKLAGGANHRNPPPPHESAPAGAVETVTPCAPAGAHLISIRIRWRTPPANFHEPSGLKRCRRILSTENSEESNTQHPTSDFRFSSSHTLPAKLFAPPMRLGVS